MVEYSEPYTKNGSCFGTREIVSNIWCFEDPWHLKKYWHTPIKKNRFSHVHILVVLLIFNVFLFNQHWTFKSKTNLESTNIKISKNVTGEDKRFFIELALVVCEPTTCLRNQFDWKALYNSIPWTDEWSKLCPFWQPRPHTRLPFIATLFAHRYR